MNGGLIPLLLLGATVGLMLAFAPSRNVAMGLGAFAAAALLGFTIPVGPSSATIIACFWLSMIVAAVAIYLPVVRQSLAAVALCLNAGFWLGASAALSGERAALGIGLSSVLIVGPAKWFSGQKFDIIIKVIGSWMIAVAALSLFVSLIPTPGYVPDHME